MPEVVETKDPLVPDTKKLSCYVENGIWSAFFLVILGIILLGGVFLAYQTRRAPRELNESRTIGVSIYTVTLIGIIALPLILFLRDAADAELAIKTFGIWLMITSSLLVLFVPKLFDSQSRVSNDDSQADIDMK